MLNSTLRTFPTKENNNVTRNWGPFFLRFPETKRMSSLTPITAVYAEGENL
jgi:hypothetical protein